MPRYRDIFKDRDVRVGTHAHKWQAVRRRCIAREPICRQCGKRPSVECHHIESIRRAPHLALTDTNVVPCCKTCHRRMDAGTMKPRPRPDVHLDC